MFEKSWFWRTACLPRAQGFGTTPGMTAADDRQRRIKRLTFRAGHRGTREMDFLLGRYAKRHLADLDDAALDRFEALMDINDQTLYAWISGAEPVPEAHDGDIMTALRAMRFTPEDFSR